MIFKILKFLIITLAFLAALTAAGGVYVYFHQDNFPESVSSKVDSFVKQGIKHYEKTRKEMELSRARKKMIASEDQVTLMLKNGGIVQGKLISETETEVTVRWEYGDAIFLRNEIAEIRKGREGDTQDFLVPTFAHPNP